MSTDRFPHELPKNSREKSIARQRNEFVTEDTVGDQKEVADDEHSFRAASFSPVKEVLNCLTEFIFRIGENSLDQE